MALNANQVTTDKVRLSYVHLDKPHSSNQDGSNAKYQVTILLPKSDIATKARLDAAYQAAVQAGVTSKWNGVMPPVIANPIHDGDGVKQNGEPFGAECKGCWVFTAGNKNPVQTVAADMSPIIQPSELYSGVYARVCVSFFAYSSNGKRGIGCGLEAVQKLEDGEPLAGSVSVNDAFGGTNAWAGAPAPVAQQPVYPQQAPTPMQGYPQQPGAPAYPTPGAYPQPGQNVGYDQITGLPLPF